MDTKGLYYNSYEPNDLHEILSTYKFSDDQYLMQNAERLMEIIREKRISKYNMPDNGDPKRHFNIGANKRVLVIGQVDNDAAIRLGNPNRWRTVDILRLAKLEHPDAEILYRPHPEVFFGYQRSRFRSWLTRDFVTIIPPEGSIVDLLESIDHVYTISSLSGLDALLSGVPVTTLGAPFYAGWGLTDDRSKAPNARTLTLPELFAGVYLKYPRYLADLNDPVAGCYATLFRILGDKQLLEIESENRAHKAWIRGEDARDLTFSGLVNAAMAGLSFPIKASTPKKVELAFVEDRGAVFQRVIASVLSTAVPDKEFTSFFSGVMDVMDLAAANAFLVDVYRHRPEVEPARVFSKLVRSEHSKTTRLEVFNTLSRPVVIETVNADVADAQRAPEQSDGDAIKRMARFREGSSLCDAADLQWEAGRYVDALGGYCQAAICGVISPHLFERTAHIAWQMFDFSSTKSLALLHLKLADVRAPWALKALWRSIPYVSNQRMLEEAAFICSAKSTYIPPAVTRVKELGSVEFNNVESEDVSRTHALAFAYDIGYAQTLLEVGKFELAYEVSRRIAQRENTYQAAVMLSKTLAYLHRYEEASELMDKSLKYHKTGLVYDEAMKLCLYTGDYAKAARLRDEALSRKIDLGETVPRKIAFGLGQVRSAFLTFRDDDITKELSNAYADTHLSATNYEFSGESIFLLPNYGPGDEIRFAAAYKTLARTLPHKEIWIGVEPRLHELFQRSFTDQRFRLVPVRRILRSQRVDVKEYDQVPYAELMAVMDNKAAELAATVDQVGLVTEVLSDCYRDFSDFDGEPYLKPDLAKVEEMRAKLPPGRPLIGLNWRSSVTLQARMEHYVSVEDLVPVFEQTNFQFVNLQYDDCEAELKWIEERFPGRVFQVPDLDQYNDLDGVAALIGALDAVVAPNTTVAELAGALNQRTFLLASSSEQLWRRRAGSRFDVWHSSMEHVLGKTYRDKGSLVAALAERLNKERFS
jgi:capsular polysaccharide export protein